MPALEQVTVRFENKTILDRFSMPVPVLGVTCLIGPSGCGKTTLLRLAAGLKKPDQGRVVGLGPGRTAFLFQEDRLLPWRTAEENIADVLPGEKREQAALWLHRVELGGEEQTYPAALSGGMRRRVALARVLAYCAEMPSSFAEGGRLLLLDEPFKGMDAALREKMMALVKSLGNPALMVTHEEDEMKKMADRVIRFSGPPLIMLDE